MTSLDQENLRRAQAERRIAMQSSDGGGAAPWVIGILAIVAIIAGIFLFGGSGGDSTAPATAAPAAEETAPAVTDEAAPATTVTE